MTIFLAWCNDMLLGVYRHEKVALDRILKYKADNPGGDWYQLSYMRWAQKNGSVARLSVEPHKVIEKPR